MKFFTPYHTIWILEIQIHQSCHNSLKIQVNWCKNERKICNSKKNSLFGLNRLKSRDQRTFSWGRYVNRMTRMKAAVSIVKFLTSLPFLFNFSWFEENVWNRIISKYFQSLMTSSRLELCDNLIEMKLIWDMQRDFLMRLSWNLIIFWNFWCLPVTPSTETVPKIKTSFLIEHHLAKDNPKIIDFQGLMESRSLKQLTTHFNFLQFRSRAISCCCCCLDMQCHFLLDACRRRKGWSAIKKLKIHVN